MDNRQYRFVKGRRAADLFVPIIYGIVGVFPAITLNALKVASVYLTWAVESVDSLWPSLPDTMK